MEDKIISLLTGFLGDYGKHCGDWYSFNCPCCAETKGVTADNKYNLEINPEELIFHCWVCGDNDGMKGRLSKLIKKYGGSQTLYDYKEIIDDFKKSTLYKLDRSDNSDLNVDFINNGELWLPEGFKTLDKSDNDASVVFKYLYDRGLDDRIIKDFNIGYVGNRWNSDFSLKNRVIVPSYDRYDELNYWLGRDYTGKNKIRYRNATVEKTKVVFNEGKVNWYEPLTLVEGVFDHMAVPNSIPLLGKTIDTEHAVFKCVNDNLHSNLNVFLDSDARKNALKIYKLFENSSSLSGRVMFIECPEGYDPSLLYQTYGKRGIINVMQRAKRINEFDLSMI